jgi:hypothetical protein
MRSPLDPEPIRQTIATLIADRERMDRAIAALESALRDIEDVKTPQQAEFVVPEVRGSLHDAVKRACLNLKDGITRQRVITEIERENPFMKPKPASVGASLINLARGDNQMLNTAIEGKGRSPSAYSILGNTVHKLSSDEVANLFDEQNTKGTGGWQSLFGALQKKFDKEHGNILLTPEHRARIYQYYHSYGGGGWQDRIKRVFRRELPHLFV